tara:strand:- start:381 stop:1613 length:1233 start_codon:yes stop_codon:yes gene_type:complete
MNFSKNLPNFTLYEKKNIYLIFFLPISLLINSTFTNIATFLIICIFLLDCKKDKKFFFLKDRNFYFLIGFNIYLILNSVLTGINIESFIRSIGFVRYILLAYAIYYYLNINNKQYERVIFKFWTFIFIIVTIDLVFEYIFGFNVLRFESNYQGRLASFTGDELKIGGFYFAFIMLSTIFIKNANNRIYYVFFIIFLTVSLLIGERSNFIKIFFMSSLFFLLLKNISLYKKIIVLFLVTLITSLIVYNNELLRNRFIDSTINLFTLEFSKTRSNHICQYNTGIEIFKDNPIFGVGLKKYRLESWKAKYAHPKPDGNVHYCGSTHPHQVHFEILSELGIVGYILLIGYFIYFIFKSFKKFKNNDDDYALVSTLFIFASLLPIIPSGSFFTSYTATLFWINYSIALRNFKTFD